MPLGLHVLLLRVFGRLPVQLRRSIVRAITPAFTVGANCVIERQDGAILLVRQVYRRRWGLPGGLLERREAPVDAVLREVREEIGLEIELVGEPAVVVDAGARRVDVVFRGVPRGSAPDVLAPRSPEVSEARWHLPDSLPELQEEAAEALVTLARATTGELAGRLEGLRERAAEQARARPSR